MKDNNHVVYINWDGFAWYYYERANAYKQTKTPVINSLMKEGVLFTSAYTGIPSITNPMQSAIAAGAWSSVTGNCYHYYHKSKNRVITLKRHNNGETIAEAIGRQGLSLASIHQFILENRGTVEGDVTKPYIQLGRNKDCQVRFKAASQLVRGQEVGKGKGQVQLKGLPRFLALYMDDLDGMGHNGMLTYGVPKVWSEEKRIHKVIKRLHIMDKKLGAFLKVCKEMGIYDQMSFILTTDHGMTPFGQQKKGDGFGLSSLPLLMAALTEMGLKVEVLQGGENSLGAKEDTQIVLLSTGLQVQLYVKSQSVDETKMLMKTIRRSLENQLYVGKIMDKEQLTSQGVMENFADLLISAKPPYHFQMDTNKLYKAGGQHDSLDETSRHIFSIMWGQGIKKGLVCEDRIYNIDFTRTMTRLLQLDGPKDATGRVLNDYLSE